MNETIQAHRMAAFRLRERAQHHRTHGGGRGAATTKECLAWARQNEAYADRLEGRP